MSFSNFLRIYRFFVIWNAWIHTFWISWQLGLNCWEHWRLRADSISGMAWWRSTHAHQATPATSESVPEVTSVPFLAIRSVYQCWNPPTYTTHWNPEMRTRKDFFWLPQSKAPMCYKALFLWPIVSSRLLLPVSFNILHLEVLLYSFPSVPESPSRSLQLATSSMD